MSRSRYWLWDQSQCHSSKISILVYPHFFRVKKKFAILLAFLIGHWDLQSSFEWSHVQGLQWQVLICGALFPFVSVIARGEWQSLRWLNGSRHGQQAPGEWGTREKHFLLPYISLLSSPLIWRNDTIRRRTTASQPTNQPIRALILASQANWWTLEKWTKQNAAKTEREK